MQRKTEEGEEMNYNKGRLKSQLKRHEGLRLASYKDSVGVLTIGYGRNLESMIISQTQADKWLKDDIEIAAMALEDAYPLIANLSEKRQRVLINMTFNLGINGIKKFKKMWEALEKCMYQTAADEMQDSRWYNQVGSRADELIKMMREG